MAWQYFQNLWNGWLLPSTGGVAGHVLTSTGGQTAATWTSPAITSANRATLVNGSVVVPLPSIANTSLVFLCHDTAGGTEGFLSAVVVPGTGFTILSSNAADNSVVAWATINIYP